MDKMITKVKAGYRPRLADQQLTRLLRQFGAVLVTGPKWCGKSWTAMNQAESVAFIDREDIRKRALLLPDETLKGAQPRVLDEWQDAPVLWDVARHAIDFAHSSGLFIFTGSSVPPKDKVRHSGTGRIARLAMLPMSLFESGESSGSISLGALFDGGEFTTQPSKLDLKRATQLICEGGWPANLWLEKKDRQGVALEYLKSLAARDVSRVRGERINPRHVMLLLRSLSRNIAQPVKATTLKADMEARDTGVLSEQTIRSYLDALRRLYVLREQESWQPNLRSKRRLQTTPKLHLACPSLAAAALGATPEKLARDLNTCGLLFESLCFRDLSVYMQPYDGGVYYYRDNYGLEVDFVLQMANGPWAALEAKLGDFEFDKAAANLLKFSKRMQDGGLSAPAFLAIVTATGGVAYEREDGVKVIPLDCLTA
jgi:predicted AAA+ superfamily ATPase